MFSGNLKSFMAALVLLLAGCESSSKTMAKMSMEMLRLYPTLVLERAFRPSKRVIGPQK